MKKTRFHFIIFISLVLFFTGCSTVSSNLNINPTAKNVILSLTCIAENSTTSFVYNYAENIGDGRGITFGIIGFTSGTYDGTLLLKHLRTLEPENILCTYIDEFEAIDSLPHDSMGLCSDTTGLENFTADFHNHGNDPFVRKAQLDMLDELYWIPAMEIAESAGAKLAVTAGQFYDTCIQHGEEGLKEIIEQTDSIMNGSPESGINEILWLYQFMEIRINILDNTSGWKGSSDRVYMYKRLLDSGNTGLVPPFETYCYGTDDSYIITGSHP